MDLALNIRTAHNAPLALEPASVGVRVVATAADALVVGAWAFPVGVGGRPARPPSPRAGRAAPPTDPLPAAPTP